MHFQRRDRLDAHRCLRYELYAPERAGHALPMLRKMQRQTWELRACSKKAVFGFRKEMEPHAKANPCRLPSAYLGQVIDGLNKMRVAKNEVERIWVQNFAEMNVGSSGRRRSHGPRRRVGATHHSVSHPQYR